MKVNEEKSKEVLEGFQALQNTIEDKIKLLKTIVDLANTLKESYPIRLFDKNDELFFVIRTLGFLGFSQLYASETTESTTFQPLSLADIHRVEVLEDD